MAIRSMMGVTWSPRESGCSSLSHSVALNLHRMRVEERLAAPLLRPTQPGHRPLLTPSAKPELPSCLLSCPHLPPPGAYVLLALLPPPLQTLGPGWGLNSSG